MFMLFDPRNETGAVKIMWWISQLVLGSNNCCAAILSIFFESLLLLTLQKDKKGPEMQHYCVPVLVAIQWTCS